MVCYRGGFCQLSLLAYWSKIKYISLVNLIMDREVVKELIQSNLNKKTLEQEFELISRKGERRDKMMEDYDSFTKN